MTSYQHTQRGGTVMYVGVAVSVFVILVFLRLIIFPPAGFPPMPGGFQLFMLLPIAITIGAMWIFSSLTVAVTATALSWHFGPGAFKKSVARSEIATVEQLRTSWWWGYGIRLTPKGWMYNVSGRDAVLVTRTDGSRFVLGTNDLPALLQALKSDSVAG